METFGRGMCAVGRPAHNGDGVMGTNGSARQRRINPPKCGGDQLRVISPEDGYGRKRQRFAAVDTARPRLADSALDKLGMTDSGERRESKRVKRRRGLSRIIYERTDEAAPRPYQRHGHLNGGKRSACPTNGGGCAEDSARYTGGESGRLGGSLALQIRTRHIRQAQCRLRASLRRFWDGGLARIFRTGLRASGGIQVSDIAAGADFFCRRVSTR